MEYTRDGPEYDATDAQGPMMQPVKMQRELFRITPPDPTEYAPRWHYCPIEGY